MWPRIESVLSELFSKRIYRILLTDGAYQSFLSNSGIAVSSGNVMVPAHLRERFESNSRLRAWLVVREIEALGAVSEATVAATLLKGPLKLYRFWDSSAETKRQGIWWFESNLIHTCWRQAGSGSEQRLRWLREHLAVPFDWSSMDRVDCISLGVGDEVPAIKGVGTRQRMYTTTGLLRGAVSSDQYWSALDQYFPGGAKQIILPFVPMGTAESFKAFLSR